MYNYLSSGRGDEILYFFRRGKDGDEKNKFPGNLSVNVNEERT